VEVDEHRACARARGYGAPWRAVVPACAHCRGLRQSGAGVWRGGHAKGMARSAGRVGSAPRMAPVSIA
jgi:hypothetical protein